jgi:hypothetical protein
MRSRLRKNWEQGGQLLSNDSRRIDVRRNRSRRRGTANAGGSSADMHHGMSQDSGGARKHQRVQGGGGAPTIFISAFAEILESRD